MSKIESGLQQALVSERKKRQNAEREAWIRKAYANFKKQEIESAITSSTKASWGGSSYSVELFPDGDYRILWNNNIGNLYDSTGVIVGIPSLSDEESDGDESDWFFDNAIDALDATIEQIIEQIIEDLAH